MTESLERGGGIALWQQIAGRVRNDIATGRFGPGVRLPTEADLATEFGVNRHTVRRAISALTDEGLLRVEQGRGSFVTEDVLDYRVGKRTRFTEIVAEQRRAPGGKLVRAAEVAADGQVAKALGIRRGAPVILIERVSEVDGRPIGVSAHYFPKKRFPELIERYRETGSITKSLNALGVLDYVRASTHVTVRLPTADEARRLGQAASKPVLVTESLNVDSDGQVVEFGRARFAGDRVRLVLQT